MSLMQNWNQVWYQDQRKPTTLTLTLTLTLNEPPKLRCDTPYKERLLLANLLPIVYWHEFLDMVLFFKALNGLVDIDSVALPTLRNIPRITRSTSNETVTYIPKKCKTVTYQRSFFIRSTRVWNVLPQQLRSTTINLPAFRKSLLDYYFLALTNVYDQDDTRTWKSICTKCNTARDLSHATYCCVWVLPC